jgi:hypothetical protein
MRDTHIPRPSRHKTGQAVVRLCGKEHYLGRYGSAEANAAYERLIAEWLANGRTLPGSAPSGPTVNEVILSYLRHAEGFAPAELYARLPLPGGQGGMRLYRRPDEGRWFLDSGDNSGPPAAPEEITPTCAFHWPSHHGINLPPEMQIHGLASQAVLDLPRDPARNCGPCVSATCASCPRPSAPTACREWSWACPACSPQWRWPSGRTP